VHPACAADFLLQDDVARELYQRCASLPIIDYHSHLSAERLAANTRFSNLTDLWISSDHYKWRAMRLNGVPERFCSGDAGDFEKFSAWAATLPLLLRNPLQDWSALELHRFFGIDEELSPATASSIWGRVNEQLQGSGFLPRDFLDRMRVEILCTTDDPADSLESHRQLREDPTFAPKVLPTFRPDRALGGEAPEAFLSWLARLEEASDVSVTGYPDFIAALRRRHDAFEGMGCRVSDHGLVHCHSAACSEAEAARIFSRMRQGSQVSPSEAECWRAHLMREFARWDAEKGWTMLLHLGAQRNNNSRLAATMGADVGCDCIGDFDHARTLNAFLDSLDSEGRLPNTILFNSNPRDNLLFATVAGNFFTDGVVGKVQYGPAWWFLDTRRGIEEQYEAMSQVGVAHNFIGMVTDSRSFLSFTRHDYFRRIVAGIYGSEVGRRLLPPDLDRLEATLKAQFYENALTRFGWKC
jgi:glucuronate isomerase